MFRSEKWSSSSSSLVWESSAIAVTVTAVAYGAWKYWWRPALERKKPFEDLPMPPDSHWLHGHLLLLNRGDVRISMSPMNAGNARGRVGLWVGPGVKAFVVTHREDVRAVLLGESNRQAMKLFQKHFAMFLGPFNLLYLGGRLWRHERATVRRAFSHGFLERAVAPMQEVVRTAVRSLQQRMDDENSKSIVMDMESIVKMITMDIFGATAFSHSFRSCETLTVCPEAKAFERMAGELTRRMANPFSITNWYYSIPTPRNQEYMAQRQLLRSFIDNIIAERRAEMAEALQANSKTSSEKETATTKTTEEDVLDSSYAQLKKKDLIAGLLEAHAAAQERDESLANACTDDVLVDVMLTLLFAGYDTTSVSLAYAFAMFATHEEIRHNCLEEIDRVCKGTESSNNKEDWLSQLVYCKGFLTEVLRMYPPVPIISRKLLKDLTLPDGYVIPSKTSVYIPIWNIQHNPVNFERPEEFHVERWVERHNDEGATVPQWRERNYQAEEQEKKSATTATTTGIAAGDKAGLVAFSGGARMCAGYSFSWQESLLAFVGLTRELHFEALPGFELIPHMRGVVQGPKGGVSLRISRREKNEK